LSRSHLTALLLTAVLSFTPFIAMPQNGPLRVPGESNGGRVLLPNGWTLTPAGEQVQVGGLPLAIALHPDGKYLLAVNNGVGSRTIDVIDLTQRKIVSQAPADESWLGLSVNADGTNVYVGGGMKNSILKFSLSEGKIAAASSVPVGNSKVNSYPGGLCFADKRLYVANNLSNELAAVDIVSNKVVASVSVGDHPYTCVVSPDGKAVYVSLWGEDEVVAVDAESLKIIDLFQTDEHPNAMVLSPDGKRLFVANANGNALSVIDVEAGQAMERISLALYAGSPAGSTPNALVLSRDGSRLYAACAGNNDVAIIDTSTPGESRVLGFIPVGWFPTALALSTDGKTLYVANGKGVRSFPSAPGQPPASGAPTSGRYEPAESPLRGAISLIPVPDSAALAKYTDQVYQNTPYSDQTRLSASASGPNPIPRRVGDKSPIQHVIYILKGSRSYDEIFGEIPEGDGDDRLAIFGETITPNHNAIAREFVLLDNFFADGESGADGYQWATAAYATDYWEKTWPSQYSGGRESYRRDSGALAMGAPGAGYIWDICRRIGISYRIYGEGFIPESGSGSSRPQRWKSLEGHSDPLYRGRDPQYSDIDRAKRFLTELGRFEKEGAMPRFQMLLLPNDHIGLPKPGMLTPRAYVAQNDQALGMIVEGITHSAFWAGTAIFVVEETAWGGRDHVDAHRAAALVVSPYARRRSVDSTPYSTCSMLRTIELILGLPPMSQYDAAATPMLGSFAEEANPAPFTLRPPKVSITDLNP